ncbi:hypothetical protein P7C70_g3476, partial [Phenoliferia sp. Uapishka_3]
MGFRIPFALGLIVLASLAAAHEHEMEDVGPYEQNFMNEEDIDSILQWHIGLQALAWGILFPIGMVLGITKSRLHVPWQSITCVLTWTASWLAHHHRGRAFHSTAHSYFAAYVKWYLILQVACGVFLKLHVMEGSRVRRGVVTAHGVIGKSFPVFGWVQMIFGGIAALGFCFGEHFGQCLAHFLMGSAFIAYALIMVRLQVQEPKRNDSDGRNLTAFDDASWSRLSSTQESLSGVLGQLAGFAMSAHAQALEFSTTIHKIFGFTLISAGLARIIETNPRAFQHLPPFLLVLSGLTFLSATEEQMQWIAGSGMDSTTYANILFSTSFVIYLVGAGLLELYERLAEDKSGFREGEEDLERGRGWFGFRLPETFPGIGARLGDLASGRSTGPAIGRDTNGEREAYEAVPLTASVSASGSSEEMDRTREREATVFDIGEEEEVDLEDDQGERYWDEKEHRAG